MALHWRGGAHQYTACSKKLPYVDKLRIVQLFEADFNSALKYILGRKLLYHGEEQGVNSNQTHGSRPGRSTHDTLTVMTLTYDLARLERLTMVSIFYDAAGCYDRMLHDLMTLTTTRMGCPKQAALCHAGVLDTMKHLIKTANGISTDFIQASDSLPLSGCGQGNGGGSIS